MNNNLLDYGLSLCPREKVLTNHVQGSTKIIRGHKCLETICNSCGRKNIFYQE